MAYVVQRNNTVGTGQATNNEAGEEIFKAYIPGFLYKPPYGYPLNKNVGLLKQLSFNPYVFSIKRTIKDQIASTKWDIKIKKEYQTNDEGVFLDTSKYEEYRKHIVHFFDNPNNNDESFEHVLRKTVDSILEMDAGVWVKVFNRQGEFQQVFAMAGETFLKNPDIHGYMGNRAEFVWPAQTYFAADILSGSTQLNEVTKLYDNVFRENAAYFQYGWTASAMPVPFGRREIVYMMNNPRTDTIYGTSPVEVLAEILLTLVYGAKYNMDFYVNNNMPDGIIQILDANQQQIEAFRERFEAQFKQTDALGQYRRKFHSYPIVNKKAEFTQFQLSAEQMQIIEQQQWFIKLVWACFGITGSELGFTEDSNKAVEYMQSKVFKRKSIVPLLNLIEYHINTQIMPEFDAPMFEFKFDHYDIDEDLKKMDLYQRQITMGVMTPEMVAEELGIDTSRLLESKQRSQAVNQGLTGGNNDFYNQDQQVDTTKSGSLKETPSSEEAGGKQELASSLKEGMSVESEHSDDPETQKKIAMDHLKEDPDYYKKLAKMEAKFFNLLPEQKLEKDNTDFESLIKRFYNETIKQGLSIVDSMNRDQLKQIGINAEIKGLPEEIMKKLDTLFRIEQFEPAIMKSIKDQFIKGLEQAGNQLNMNFIPNQKAIEFLQKYTFDNIKGLNNEVREKLRKALTQGIIQRETPSQIKERVSEVTDFSRNRVETIARTETNNALNAGRLEGAYQSKLKLKKYISVHLDDRTSPTCRALHEKYGTAKKAIPLNEKFHDPVQNKDFETAGFHCNCRSRVLFTQVEE